MTVTDEDREAAYLYLSNATPSDNRADDLVQAFAAHRIAASQAERDAVVKWLRADAKELEDAPSSVANRLQAEAIHDCANAIEAGKHLTPPTA